MGFFDGKGPKSDRVQVAGHDLICPVCGGELFWERDSQLNTTGMTFLGLDWANTSATNYVCANCGYMFWFHPND